MYFLSVLPGALPGAAPTSCIGAHPNVQADFFIGLAGLLVLTGCTGTPTSTPEAEASRVQPVITGGLMARGRCKPTGQRFGRDRFSRQCGGGTRRRGYRIRGLIRGSRLSVSPALAASARSQGWCYLAEGACRALAGRQSESLKAVRSRSARLWHLAVPVPSRGRGPRALAPALRPRLCNCLRATCTTAIGAFSVATAASPSTDSEAERKRSPCPSTAAARAMLESASTRALGRARKGNAASTTGRACVK